MRPKNLVDCPKLIQLLLERGLDSDKSKRPSMQFIYSCMQSLDRIVNEEPLKTLIKPKEDLNQELLRIPSDAYSSNKSSTQ